MLCTLVANDADSGDNGRITYSLVNGDGSASGFRIHPVKGVITSRMPLDREYRESYTLRVIATDHAHEHAPLGPSSTANEAPSLYNRARSSTATVRLTVLDLDDNAPSFSSYPRISVPGSYKYTFRATSLNRGDAVGTVQAIDRDSSPYASFTYRIVTKPRASDTTSSGGRHPSPHTTPPATSALPPPFSVHPLNGQIIAEEDLRSPLNFQFYISATDSSGRGDTALVTVRSPRAARVTTWTSPVHITTAEPATDNNNTVTIRHSTSDGVPLSVLFAAEDAPTNAMLSTSGEHTPVSSSNRRHPLTGYSYHLTGETLGHLMLDERSGLLTQLQPLTSSSYSFTVLAMSVADDDRSGANSTLRVLLLISNATSSPHTVCFLSIDNGRCY